VAAAAEEEEEVVVVLLLRLLLRLAQARLWPAKNLLPTTAMLPTCRRKYVGSSAVRGRGEERLSLFAINARRRRPLSSSSFVVVAAAPPLPSSPS
jgi:hypothetical protein